MIPLGKERLDEFQRAIAATCRAIAHRPGLNVSFRTGDKVPAPAASRGVVRVQNAGVSRYYNLDVPWPKES